MLYIAAVAGVLLLSVSGYLFLGRRSIAGRPCSRFRFCRLCRRSGFSFAECRFLFPLFARVSTAAPEAVFASETMLLRVLDLYIEDVRDREREGALRDTRLSRAFRIRHAVAAGLRSGRGRFRHTFSLQAGIRFAITASGSERICPATLVERQQGYLVCTRPEGQDGLIRTGQRVSVTFWIPGESGYRFESEVLDEVEIDGESLLFLSHSSHLKRVQQRKFHRAGCEIGVTWSAPEEDATPSGHGTILDISAEGVSLRSGCALAVGERVRLQFVLEGQGECRPLARVLAHRDSRYSLQFVSAELADQNRILLYLHRPGQ